MEKYVLRFWFEHGGICIWGKNEAAKEKYGYSIENYELPISEELINLLDSLESEYVKCINWDSPLDESPWTKEERLRFIDNANYAYAKLVKELGSEYEIINDITECVYVE